MNATASTYPSQSAPRLRSQRGSVLAVALIFSIIVAAAVGSYLNVARNTSRISNRAFYANAAVNLAEAGLEQAIWALNKNTWNGDWTGGSEKTAKFEGFNYDQNSTGFVRVYVQTGSAPLIVARATIEPAFGQAVEKWVEVQLIRRSMWANQMVAKNKITITGNNSSVRAYWSSLGPYQCPLPAGTVLPNGVVLATARTNDFALATVAAGSIETGGITQGNADIWGFVSIGSDDPNDLSIGPNGTLGGEDENGVQDPNNTKDLDRVTVGFKPDFDDATAPNATYTTIPAISGTKTLPGATDTAAADGVYYYYVPSISLSGNASTKLTISPGKEVVIKMGGTISVGGSASIEVSAGSTLEVYTPYDVSIAGGGLVNPNAPTSFGLTSTRASDATGPTQDIKVAGNGVLSAVVYAPNADLTLNGGGTNGKILGGSIANNITLTGHSVFVCDLSLDELSDEKPFGLGAWRELTSATDRSAHSSHLSF